jgi:hypothetical protein
LENKSTRKREEGTNAGEYDCNSGDDGLEHDVEIFSRHLLPNVVGESVKLDEAEYA